MSATKAKKVLADLRKQRDDFRDTMKKQSEANEAAWIQAKAKLEADWRLFEAEEMAGDIGSGQCRDDDQAPAVEEGAPLGGPHR
jgi:hypothetical protein